MIKKIIFNQKGLTFIELMIAIAIIVIISAVSVVYIRGNVMDEVDMMTDQFAADIRYTRNLAVSKAVYDFSGHANPTVAALGTVYPPGGYGVNISRNDGFYKIFADSGVDGVDAGSDPVGLDDDTDIIIKTVMIDNSLIEIGDANSNSSTFNHFTFKSENEAVSNLLADTYGRYEMEIDYAGPGYPEKGYRGVLRLGETSDEGYVWVSLGKSVAEYSHSAPDPDPDPKEDPVMMEIPIE